MSGRGYHHARYRGAEAPSRLPRFSTEAAAYLGAWLDSDGCITQGRMWVISIGTTTVEHLSTFLRLTQAGSVGLYPPSKYRYNSNVQTQTPFWRWSLQRRAEVRDFLNQVRPYSIKAQNVSI